MVFHATNEQEQQEIGRQVGKYSGILVAPNLSNSFVLDKVKKELKKVW